MIECQKVLNIFSSLIICKVWHFLWGFWICSRDSGHLWSQNDCCIFSLKCWWRQDLITCEWSIFCWCISLKTKNAARNFSFPRNPEQSKMDDLYHPSSFFLRICRNPFFLQWAWHLESEEDYSEGSVIKMPPINHYICLRFARFVLMRCFREQSRHCSLYWGIETASFFLSKVLHCIKCSFQNFS